MLGSWNAVFSPSTSQEEEKPLPLPVPCSQSYMSTFQEEYEALVLIYKVGKQMGLA
jgi:hypothetical protein